MDLTAEFKLVVGANVPLADYTDSLWSQATRNLWHFALSPKWNQAIGRAYRLTEWCWHSYEYPAYCWFASRPWIPWEQCWVVVCRDQSSGWGTELLTTEMCKVTTFTKLLTQDWCAVSLSHDGMRVLMEVEGAQGYNRITLWHRRRAHWGSQPVHLFWNCWHCSQ